ncbi:MAG: flp pilus-assembly TadE/G-like family protein [Nocardioidaceae bacterium]|nr:MAG: flp pilus-assembly TadE/G-like family protein [Nocardioidaceae bacterium]
MGSHRPIQHGFVTPFTAAICGFLAILAVASAAGGAVLVGQRRAESAADLAALAGATAIQNGQAGCTAAETVAADNRGILIDCVIEGEVVEVRIRHEVTLVGRDWRLHATARAGPA